MIRILAMQKVHRTLAAALAILVILALLAARRSPELQAHLPLTDDLDAAPRDFWWAW